MLRDNPADLSEGAQRLTRPAKKCGLFKNLQVTAGSIGLSMARLWKEEVAACILPSVLEKPWDVCPVLGITKKLGFLFFEIDPQDGKLTKIEVNPGHENVEWQKERLVIQGAYLSQVSDYNCGMPVGL